MKRANTLGQSQIGQKTQRKMSESHHQNVLQIPQQLASLQTEGQTTQTMIVRLKQSHMQQQNQLVKDLKYMSEQSKKIIDEISVIEVQLQKYQVQIDAWIKNVSDMQGFVSKVKGLQEPFATKCKNMSKLKQYLAGERTRRR